MLNHTTPQCMNASLGSGRENEISHENLIGVAIAVGANTIIPIALNLQKYAHTRNIGADGKPLLPITKIPLWWMGICLMVGGEFFNLLAYGYSPTSLVAPVGAIGVLVNGVIATAVMKESFRWARDGVGLAAIALGVVMVVSSVPDVQFDIEVPSQIIHLLGFLRAKLYFLACAIFIPVWGLAVIPKYKHRHPIVYLIMCSVIASITVVASRAFSSIVTNFMAEPSAKRFSRIVSWVSIQALATIILTAIWSTAYLNKAMAIFPNNKVVPVYYVTFTLASVSAGAIVYFEFDCMSVEHMCLFVIGCFVTFGGVFMTASKSETQAQVFDTGQSVLHGYTGDGEHDAVGSTARGRHAPTWFARRRLSGSGNDRSTKLTDDDSAARRHVEMLDEPLDPVNESPRSATDSKWGRIRAVQSRAGGSVPSTLPNMLALASSAPLPSPEGEVECDAHSAITSPPMPRGSVSAAPTPEAELNGRIEGCGLDSDKGTADSRP